MDEDDDDDDDELEVVSNRKCGLAITRNATAANRILTLRMRGLFALRPKYPTKTTIIVCVMSLALCMNPV